MAQRSGAFVTRSGIERTTWELTRLFCIDYEIAAGLKFASLDIGAMGLLAKGGSGGR